MNYYVKISEYKSKKNVKDYVITNSIFAKI